MAARQFTQAARDVWRDENMIVLGTLYAKLGPITSQKSCY